MGTKKGQPRCTPRGRDADGDQRTRRDTRGAAPGFFLCARTAARILCINLWIIFEYLHGYPQESTDAQLYPQTTTQQLSVYKQRYTVVKCLIHKEKFELSTEKTSFYYYY